MLMMVMDVCSFFQNHSKLPTAERPLYGIDEFKGVKPLGVFGWLYASKKKEINGAKKSMFKCEEIKKVMFVNL